MQLRGMGLLWAAAMVPAAVGISSIPYDSTLVLGNVIQTDKITQLKSIADLQKKVDLAQDRYNALLRTRLSLDMSIEELGQLGIGDDARMKELTEKKKKLDQDIVKALGDRLDARIGYTDAYSQMLTAGEQTKIGEEPESPFDFATSKLQSMPLSSDTMTLDVQYFRNEEGKQGSQSHAKKVSSWVSASVSSVFGTYAASSKAEASAEQHMNKQTQSNELLGTIVIFVSATHKNAKMFSPTKYDPLKLVGAWNAVNSGEQIDLPAKTEDHYKEWVTAKSGKEGGGSLSLLTGVTYGSSFIGFIHFVKSSQTQNSETMRASAAAAQGTASLNNFIGSITGGFGLDSKTANDLKQMVSSNEILSHVGLITHGIIPSLASQNVATSLKEFSQFSPDAVDGQLEVLANGQNTDAPDMDSQARSNVRAGRIASVQRNTIKSVLSGVQETDKANNQVLDMNSLMLSLDDYIKNARNADGGVPVNFFVSSVDKKDVLAEWFQEFRPELYRAAMNGKNPWDDEGAGKGGGK